MAMAAIALGLMSLNAGSQEDEPVSFTIYPVGHVREADGKTYIEISGKYEDALLGLDGFSHVYVIWWFHKNDTPEKRRILRVHPRGNADNPLTGVFATRSPVRPNLIALSICKVLSVEGRRIYVEKIDAFAGTPVVDLKPYVPGERIADARFPKWLK
jgi:tRNA-Thr(GGU) m(6)t(6)A37 methyltransferase TsaA